MCWESHACQFCCWLDCFAPTPPTLPGPSAGLPPSAAPPCSAHRPSCSGTRAPDPVMIRQRGSQPTQRHASPDPPCLPEPTRAHTFFCAERQLSQNVHDRCRCHDRADQRHDHAYDEAGGTSTRGALRLPTPGWRPGALHLPRERMLHQLILSVVRRGTAQAEHYSSPATYHHSSGAAPRLSIPRRTPRRSTPRSSLRARPWKPSPPTPPRWKPPTPPPR